jgi:hypothetical protein
VSPAMVAAAMGPDECGAQNESFSRSAPTL